MKIQLVQSIHIEGSYNGVKFINKSYETDIMPHVGDYVSDPLWKDPYDYEILSVLIDFKENHCRVNLADLEVANKDTVELMLSAAVKYHGWSEGGALLG